MSLTREQSNLVGSVVEARRILDLREYLGIGEGSPQEVRIRFALRSADQVILTGIEYTAIASQECVVLRFEILNFKPEVKMEIPVTLGAKLFNGRPWMIYKEHLKRLFNLNEVSSRFDRFSDMSL